MGRCAKFFLWVVMVLIFLCAVLGGALYIMYRLAEPQPPEITVTFNGRELTGAGMTWTTPVLGSWFGRTDETQAERASLGVIDTAAPEIAVSGADKVTVEAYRGGELAASRDGAGVLNLPENGEYTLRVLCTVTQRRETAGSGTFVYEASFTLKAVPQIMLEPETAQQGDVIVVRVEGILDGSVPQIETELSPAYFTKTETGYAALLGVHYNRAGGVWPVTVTCGGTVQELSVTVTGGQYESVQETVPEELKQSAAASSAALKEFNDAMYGVYYLHDAELYFDGAWKWPVATGVLTVPYGAFVYENGSEDASRHTGADLSVSIDTPVTAPAAGRVVYAGWLERTGWTLVIEHGAGIKSYLFHLASLTCAEGDFVEQGVQVGVSGITGYSAKPHVHFEVRVGNQSVDPARLVNGTSAAVK